MSYHFIVSDDALQQLPQSGKIPCIQSADHLFVELFSLGLK